MEISLSRSFLVLGYANHLRSSSKVVSISGNILYITNLIKFITCIFLVLLITNERDTYVRTYLSVTST